MQSRVSDLISKNLTQREFCSRYPNSALLFSTNTPADDTVETDIRNISDTDLLSCLENSENPQTNFINSRVFFLEKTTRNQIPEISVGRSDKNDIILSYSTVSRCHCLFRNHGAYWTVIDNGSKNSTYLNNCRLTPFKAEILLNNYLLSFGDEAPARFLTSEGLWETISLFNALKFSENSD